jgi:hypothetical protein
LLRAILRLTRLALPSAFALACSAAAPVDLGSDPVGLPEAEIGAEEQPSGTLEPGGETIGLVKPFMSGATGHCEASFQPCGGWLPGTSWVIEDTCTSLSPGRNAQLEGSELLGLDPDACRNVVQSLTSKWSGELNFAEDYLATDSRMRQRQFDIALGAECFNATFGVDASEAELTSFCKSIEGPSASCVPAADGCRCAAATTFKINNHGRFSLPTDSQATITGVWYDYCVEGNRLMWGDPGTNTHIVMRRRDGTYVPPVEATDEPEPR